MLPNKFCRGSPEKASIRDAPQGPFPRDRDVTTVLKDRYRLAGVNCSS